jgi:uncharacterized protein Smg (DUF494 family)
MPSVQPQIVDLIVVLVKRMRLGEDLSSLPPDAVSAYNAAQLSAAYSWILQRNPVALRPTSPRVLHFAERMMISPESYGYLLDLTNLGVLDALSMEKVIEKVMFHSLERMPLDKVKAIVAEVLLDKGTSLSGSESIH